MVDSLQPSKRRLHHGQLNVENIKESPVMAKPLHCIRVRGKPAGVTLVEMMVTVAIAAILMSIAAPSMSSFLTRGRISAHVNDMVGAINLARSEAVKRGDPVTICRSSDQASCATALGGWESGWIVFSDPNLNGIVDAGDTLINAFAPLPNGATAVGNTAMADNIIFNSSGRPGATFSGALATICPVVATGSAQFCRYICINAQGRPRVDTPDQYAADTACGN